MDARQGKKAPTPQRPAPLGLALARGNPWHGGHARGSGQSSGAKTQASPFRPLLSLVRTGRSLVPTALLPSVPQLCSREIGKDVGKQASQRLLETEMLRDAETDTKGKGSVQRSTEVHCEPSRPWALWEPGGPAPGELQAGPPCAQSVLT